MANAEESTTGEDADAAAIEATETIKAMLSAVGKPYALGKCVAKYANGEQIGMASKLENELLAAGAVMATAAGGSLFFAKYAEKANAALAGLNDVAISMAVDAKRAGDWSGWNHIIGCLSAVEDALGKYLRDYLRAVG